MAPRTQRVLRADRLDGLVRALQARGYTCVGPTLRDGAIVYDRVRGSADLPRGWTDEQRPGHYRVRRRDDEAFFGYVVGPHSWKKFLFPPERRLWRLRRTGRGFERVDEPQPAPRFAFLGVRACEIAALRIQDRVFQGGAFVDPEYAARREASFVVAVECVEAGGTCFCVSMETGPAATEGFDLALTEVLGDEHVFVVRAGTDRGREVLDGLETEAATDAQAQAARAGVEHAARNQGRAMDTRGIQDLLQRHYESPQWDEVAERCLACANCTLACPTCFCSDVEDTNDLTGDHAERWKRWDSCFNPDFSHMAGGEVRRSIASRYRQWMTHKLSTWYDQFGSTGCVGCGRCLTWCPVGIDITEEVARMRTREETRR